MIIDAHSHLEERLCSVEKVLAEMDSQGVSKMVLAGHLTDPPEGRKPESLMKIQRYMYSVNLLRPLAIQITKAMYAKEGEWNLLGLQYFMKTKETKYKIVTKPDNATIYNVTQKYKNRFLGWIFINPKFDDAMPEIESYISKQEMIGVKLHPFWHGFSLRKIDHILSFCQSKKILVNIHLGFGESGDYEYVISKFPQLKVVWGHLGVPYYKKAWRAILSHQESYLDLASTYHVDERLSIAAVKMLGPRRILYATDTPYTSPGSAAVIKNWIERLPISVAERNLIFYENFQRAITK